MGKYVYIKIKIKKILGSPNRGCEAWPFELYKLKIDVHSKQMTGPQNLR